MCSSEDSDLKRLLASWHCEILYNLFREEDINIEELKYIKYRHIRDLLKNYKMGVRIRFEHYLESWRNKIGIPFNNEDNANAENISCACTRIQPAKPNREAMLLNGHSEPAAAFNINCAKDSENGIENHMNLLSPQSIKESDFARTAQASPEAPSAGRVLRRSSCRKTEKELTTLESEENLNTSYFPNTPLTTKDAPVNNNHNNSGRNNFNKCPYSLPQILQMSGSRGITIIKYYEEHREFTTSQRTQLIQTICDFYEDNEYHLSLHMSHAIETEILQMFPSERLQYYRTEKRGKLYVKFTNMKRYRKERGTGRTAAIDRGAEQLPFVPNRDENQIKVQNMAEISECKTENNMDTASCDTWPEGAEADINIKSEELNEI